MARAKRLNAEKVTISIDSSILLDAKHTALDQRLTLSDYIQELVRKDLKSHIAPRYMKGNVKTNTPDSSTPASATTGEKEIGVTLVPPVKSSNKKFTPLPEVDSIILDMRNNNEPAISFSAIAIHLNDMGYRNPTVKGEVEFNDKSVDRRYKKLMELEEE